MIKAACGLSQNWFIGFLIGFIIFSARADQPPEILYATAPYTAILNLGATNSALLANASVCDAAGNFYVTGSFEGIAKFGTNSLSSNGGYNYDDVFVVKYDPAGTVLWARSAGGSGKDFGRAITLDGVGGTFVAGTSDSQPFVIGTNSINNNGGQGVFLAHYDGNGNVLWMQWGGALSVFQSATLTVNGLAHDASGNVIMAGSFFGNPTIGNALSPVPINLANKASSFYANSAEDLLLAKFAPNGALLWATNYGGTNTEYATSVAVDSTGAIYTSGSFTFTTTFGAQTYTNANDGILLAKFSSAGDLVWSSNLSDPTNNNRGAAWTVAVDAADRVNVSFQFDDSAFYTTGFRYHGYIVTNNNFVAMNLLAQFDTTGNVLWLQRSPLSAGGIPNGAKYQRTQQNSLALDRQNNIYLGGGGLVNGSGGGLSISKCNASGLGIWTNVVPSANLPVLSVDDAGITHVSTTVVGDVGAYFTVGWTNIYPGFGGFGKDAIMFAIASNFVAVPPIFLQQPTNMVYQPPKGLTNSVLARAWPAPRYFWYINNSRLPSQTNFFLALGPTTFTNQTTYFVVATNAYGSATSVVVTAQASLSLAPSPPTNIYVLVGTTLAISGGANGTSPATYQWQFKGTNILGATSATLALPNIALNQGGNYTLVLSNASTVITSTPPTIVTVLPVGSIDPSYTNNLIAPSSLARLPDGSYLAATGLGVSHISANGLIATNGFVVYPYRWNDSSSADQYLGPSLVILQPDGKIMVAGNFKVYYTNATTFTNASRIARLNPNGSLDNTFNVGVGPLYTDGTTSSTNYTKIECVIPLANGQYLAAGTFNQFNGLPITNLVRLNNDGSLDATFPRHAFARATSALLGIHSLALQADGKILLGGVFDAIDGITNRNLTRLNTNGTVDTSFVQTSLIGTQGNTDRVNTLLVLPDGKILAAGAGNSSALVNRVARFNTDGSRDLTWVGVLPSEVYCMTLTTSNKLIFGCNSYVRRTTYDGTNDVNFGSASGNFFSAQFVYAIAQEPSGNVMLGGSFGMRRLLLEPLLVVPTFSSGAGVGVVNGQFQISACGGVEGQNIVVQASTDLVNWNNVSTNVVTGGCISYADTQTPPLPSRYYRLTVLP